MAEILEEITHLTPKDCYFIVERHKRTFDYPIHQHAECELNFVENGKGVKRIVGSSVEEIGEYDLALINSPSLPHMWDQNDAPPRQIREITIHFSPDLLGDSLMSRNQFASIKEMLERAKHGLAFPTSAIMKVYSLLDVLANEKNSFKQFLSFVQILYELSRSKYRELDVTAGSEQSSPAAEDPRIASVKDYVASKYNEDITLEQLADIAGMTPTAFSRFFKLHTGLHYRDPFRRGVPCAGRHFPEHLGDLLQLRIQQSVELQPYIQIKTGRNTSRLPDELQEEKSVGLNKKFAVFVNLVFVYPYI